MKILIVTLLPLSLAWLASTSSMESPKEGWASPEFKEARSKLLADDSLYVQHKLMTCINGAAFVLAGQERWAKQYESTHGVCIQQLVDRAERKF